MDALQLLTPDGELRSDCPLTLDVTPELCRDLYRRMRLARRFDEEAYALQRQGELGLWLQSLGQEAAQVGSISAIQPTDHVFPSYREHAAALCRGITPVELLTQWRGASNSGWDPQRYRFHIYTLVLAVQLLHATGYAIGAHLDGADEMVLAYFGDGASSEGDTSEALNWAAVASAPVLFFCQNNQCAIATPTQLQMRTPLHQRAVGFGVEGHVVDGNDVLAVYALTRQVADAVRESWEPALIEAVTYRMGGHSTADDPTRYRTSAEVDSWRARDPIARLGLLLGRQGWADDAFRDELRTECEDLAADARRACAGIEPMSIDELYTSVFVDEPGWLRREREELQAYLGSLVE